MAHLHDTLMLVKKIRSDEVQLDVRLLVNVYDNWRYAVHIQKFLNVA